MMIEKVTREEKDFYPLLLITDIDWDTDGEDIDDLPTSIKFEWTEGIDYESNDYEPICEWLSEEYGWTLNGFSVEELPKEVFNV